MKTEKENEEGKDVGREKPGLEQVKSVGFQREYI